MDLSDILKKNKDKIGKVKTKVRKTNISTKERPYSELVENKSNKKIKIKENTKNQKSDKKVESKALKNEPTKKKMTKQVKTPYEKEVTSKPNKKEASINSNVKQPAYKHDTNLDTSMNQPAYKHDTNLDTSMNQPMYKHDTNFDTSIDQPKYKHDTNLDTKHSTNLDTKNNHKTEPKNIKNTIYLVQAMSGIKELVLGYIVNICSIKGTLMTPPISTKSISIAIGKNQNSVRVAIARLKKDEILKTNNLIKGSSFTTYEITEEVKLAYIEHKNNNHNYYQIGNNHNTNLDTNHSTNPDSDHDVVSSSNINTNTTLPEEWSTLDIECLKDRGLKENHIIQIYRTYKEKPDLALDFQAIQDSIYAMAYDLQHNADSLGFKIPPVSMLTALLKKGKPYCSKTPEDYLSPKELEIQKYLEGKKLRAAKLEQMEQEMFKFELDDWLNSLGKSEKDKILSTANTNKALSDRANRRIESGHLNEYFKENVWPEIKQSVMSGNRETVS